MSPKKQKSHTTAAFLDNLKFWSSLEVFLDANMQQAWFANIAPQWTITKIVWFQTFTKSHHDIHFCNQRNQKCLVY